MSNLIKCISKNVDNEIDANRYLEKGYEHYKNGNFDRSLKYLDHLIKCNMNDAKAHYLKGSIFAMKQLYEDALSEFSKSLEINPSQDYVYSDKGIVNYLLGNYELAIESLNEAIRLKPSNHRYMMLKGNCFILLHQYENALESIDCALDTYIINDEFTSDDVAYFYLFKGLALIGLKMFPHALDALQMATKLNEKLADAYNNRGVVYFHLNKYGDALLAFDIARVLDVKHEIFQNNYRLILNYLKSDADVFISFNSDDESFSTFYGSLAESLENAHMKVWSPYRYIEYKYDKSEVAQVIKEAKTIMCLVTKKYLKSKLCRYEARKAIESGKKVLLVLLENVSLNNDEYFKNNIDESSIFHLYKSDHEYINRAFNCLRVFIQIPFVLVSTGKIDCYLKPIGKSKNTEVSKVEYDSCIYAMKQYYFSKLKKDVNTEAVKNTMESFSLISHENIVEFYGYYFLDTHIMFFEYMYGTLYNYLYEEKIELDKLAILKCIHSGLSYLHYNCHIMQGNLSSRNVFLNEDCTVAKLGESYIYKDFLQKRIGTLVEDDFDVFELSIGSVRWKSPEQHRGEVSVSFESDVWSFGIIVLEVMNNEFPFEYKTPRELEEVYNAGKSVYFNLSRLSPNMSELVSGCLDFDPTKRRFIKEFGPLLKEEQKRIKKEKDANISVVQF